MDIRYQDIIKLDDKNEYIVVSKVCFEGNEYIYLVDINNNKNIKFAQIEKEGYISELNNVQDSNLIKTLIPLFYDSSKKDIKNIPN